MPSRTVNRSEMEPYRQTPDEVLNAFDTSARSGLRREQAQERLKRYGKNELATEASVPAWRKFLAQFTDILVVLLIVAALISAGLWLYERDSALPYEAIAILAIVLLNALMGYLQQARAEQAVAALRQMSAAHADVIRDGARQSILASELVPGDVILVEEGDTVPADARLIQSTALQTAEAALTGESLPVSKDTAAHRRRRWTRRSAQHDLQWYGGDLRPRARGGYGDGDANPNGAHRRHAEGNAGRNHAAAEGARSCRQAAGDHRRRHRHGDDRDDHPRRGRARFLGYFRRADPGSSARGCGGAGRPAGDGDGRALPWRAAHGEKERHRPPSRGGRDARLGEHHRVRQDRNAHQERDDGARGRYGKRARDLHAAPAMRRKATSAGTEAGRSTAPCGSSSCVRSALPTAPTTPCCRSATDVGRCRAIRPKAR